MRLLPQYEIVEQTETKLVFHHRNGLLLTLFLLFWILGFGGIPLGMLVLISSEYGVTTLACQRAEEPKQINCQWSQSQYLGLVTTVQDRPIEQVTTAKLDSAQWSNGQGGGTKKVWVSMVTRNGTTKLFESQFAIESGFQPTFQPEVVANVQAFINSQRPSLTLEEDLRLSEGFWGGALVFLPFPLLAALIAYGGFRAQTLLLDKVSNLFTCNIRTLLGTRIKTYPLDMLQSIQVKERWDDYTTYQLIFRFKSGEKYGLPYIYQASKVQQVADQCRDFLALPSEENL